MPHPGPEFSMPPHLEHSFPPSILSAAIFVLLLLLPFHQASATSPSSIATVPLQLRSNHFSVTIDGQPAYLLNAAANYYDLNFDLKGPTTISITAPTFDYWARGVEVQPWRENIRPVRTGATITFTLDHPAKLSISRPGDHLARAEMIFLFANEPERDVPSASAKNIRFYGPGIHRENIDAHTGDRIYLAPGAVILGGLNIWDVDDVKVFGRGTILYDGPQDPDHDEGWMNKKNWHVIVMHNAHHVEITGITCIVRSRTWMIQMRDSRFILFDNVKVIGGSPGNANQDGMDWLGGGDTIVRNSFIRAADDIFAMYGNWDGYTPDVISIPGHDVSNITVEKNVLSTSISNVVRVGWPKKIFNSRGFTMRDSDVIHMGSGGCGIPFALFEIWGVPDAKGTHIGYVFDDVRLEDWYSLVQLQQQSSGIDDVTFRNIWAPESSALVPSTLIGSVHGVHFDAVKFSDHLASTAQDLKLLTSAGASAPLVNANSAPVQAQFSYRTSGTDRTVLFDASTSTSREGEPKAYAWFFGDGSTGTGRILNHTFPDAQGTLLDGSGRNRVMLRVSDAAGNADWTIHSVVTPATIMPAALLAPSPSAAPGLEFAYYKGAWPSLPRFQQQTPLERGVARSLNEAPHQNATNFGLVFDGFLRITAAGGYTFSVLSRDGSRLNIDGTSIAQSGAPWPQVCGSVGNAVQSASGSVGLAAGLHRIHLEFTKTTGDSAFSLMWEGPSTPLSPVPETAFFHSSTPE